MLHLLFLKKNPTQTILTNDIIQLIIMPELEKSLLHEVFFLNMELSILWK